MGAELESGVWHRVCIEPRTTVFDDVATLGLGQSMLRSYSEEEDSAPYTCATIAWGSKVSLYRDRIRSTMVADSRTRRTEQYGGKQGGIEGGDVLAIFPTPPKRLARYGDLDRRCGT